MMTATARLPDFLARYGLTRDPFTDDDHDAPWFETPALAQRLELIQHLVEFGNQLILVTGELGSGKTRLLTQLIEAAALDWRLCVVRGDPGVDRERLLREMGAAFELQHRDVRSADVLLEHVQSHLNSSERSMLTPVLVVDDAHLLPADAVDLVFTLNQPGEGQARLRSLLFCEPAILTTLSQPQLKRFQESIVHRLDIPAFNAAQIRDYIVERLTRAGMPSGFRYDDGEFQRIFRASAGLPGNVNVLARQSLLDGRLEQRSRLWDFSLPALKFPSLSVKPWQMLSVAAIIGLALSLWWIKTLLDEWLAGDEVPAQVPLQLPSSPASPPAPQPAPAPTPVPRADSKASDAGAAASHPPPPEGMLGLEAIEPDLPLPQSRGQAEPAPPGASGQAGQRR